MNPLLKAALVCFAAAAVLILLASAIQAAPAQDAPVGGCVRIANPPAHGWQVLWVQEDGKNMLQGGWHRITVNVTHQPRYWMGDAVTLTHDAWNDWRVR